MNPEPCAVCHGKKIMVKLAPGPRRFAYCPVCLPEKNVSDPEAVPWGIYDNKGRCWLGDEHGPMLYEARELAALGATVIGERLQDGAHRLAARLYSERAGTKRDEITPKLSLREALENLQSRAPS